MTYTTLAIVDAPTLAGGLVELLRIGDALQLAGDDCGVQLYRWEDGRLAEAEPDYELPPGVLSTVQRVPVEPWPGADHELAVADAMARRELLEVLAHLNPDRDLLATAEGVGYLR